jgi:hypothetical protein
MKDNISPIEDAAKGQWPPDTEEISEYGGPAFADSRKIVVLQVGR